MTPSAPTSRCSPHPEAVQEHHQSTYRVNAIPVGDWPVMVWAGQLAGLRWLRDHGHDTPANSVDVRCLGWDDTAEADRWIRRYDLPDCAGQDLAQQLLDGHWPAGTPSATCCSVRCSSASSNLEPPSSVSTILV